jgi:hypothetical protein
MPMFWGRTLIDGPLLFFAFLMRENHFGMRRLNILEKFFYSFTERRRRWQLFLTLTFENEHQILTYIVNVIP